MLKRTSSSLSWVSYFVLKDILLSPVFGTNLRKSMSNDMKRDSYRKPISWVAQASSCNIAV